MHGVTEEAMNLKKEVLWCLPQMYLAMQDGRLIIPDLSADCSNAESHLLVLLFYLMVMFAIYDHRIWLWSVSETCGVRLMVGDVMCVL